MTSRAWMLSALLSAIALLVPATIRLLRLGTNSPLPDLRAALESARLVLLIAATVLLFALSFLIGSCRHPTTPASGGKTEIKGEKA